MRRALPLLAALTLVGCPQSTTVDDPDDPDADVIMFDPIPDAGTDAGPVVSATIGTPCTVDTDCGDEGVCITEMQGFAAGYCTASCPTLEECPAGSVCVDFGMGQLLCLDQCDPAAEERECRQFYGCAQGGGLEQPACLPGCTDDTDCPGGACNPSFGGSCYDPDAEWYDPCQYSSDCPDGGRCRDEDRGQPGGMCTAFGCDVEANTGCPGDGQCIPGGRSGFGRCIDGCETAEDCRAGYTCAAPEAYPDRMTCTPACASNADCPDTGICDTTTGECGA